MRLYKIAALMYADMMTVRNSKWRLAEYFYFPLTTVVIWGLFSLFVQSYAVEAGLIVLAVNVLWSFAYLAQSHTNMQINEDSWSGSLKQIIITGVTDFEYITARILSATIMSLFVLALILAVAVFAFGMTVIAQNMLVFTVLIAATLVVSIALSIFVAASMIALGKEYGFLAWTAMQLFILLSAPFYPISFFPEAVQPVIMVMPYTNVFEATRQMITGQLDMQIVSAAVIVAVAYLLVSLPFYRFVFRKARQRGWLVRLS